MGLSAFQDLFGAAAGTIALVVLAVILALVIWAVIKGREVSFGPIRVGARTETRESRGEGEPTDRELTAERAPHQPVDEEFHTDRAREFYQRIAPSYDRRNSAKLIETQRETIRRIRQLRDRRPNLRVLDLGGGTGNIARGFSDDDAVSWTYVDFCPAMATQFARNLSNTRLARHMKIHVTDLTRLRRVAALRQGCYDVVLLSIVLSSMPRLPDFKGIARMLAPGGVLITADINPPYTRSKPHYTVTVDGVNLALRTNPVHPLDLARYAAAAGLRMVDEPRLIGTRAVDYSFIAVFATAGRQKTRPAHPPVRTRRRLLRRLFRRPADRMVHAPRNDPLT